MGAFKLGKMTFGSLFKKPETILYPIETKEPPAGLKGHIEIDVENCILCSMCDRSCPTDCLTVDKAARCWKINRYQCIQCGYCTTVCPKNCLHMIPGYAPAAVSITADTFEIPQDAKATDKAGKAEKADKAATPAPAAAEAEPQADAIAPADPVLEAKIALLDPEKAAKVRNALGR